MISLLIYIIIYTTPTPILVLLYRSTACYYTYASVLKIELVSNNTVIHCTCTGSKYLISPKRLEKEHTKPFVARIIKMLYYTQTTIIGGRQREIDRSRRRHGKCVRQVPVVITEVGPTSQVIIIKI